MSVLCHICSIFLPWPPCSCWHILSAPLTQSLPRLCMIFLVSFCSLWKSPSSEKSSVAAAAKSLQSCPTVRPRRWQPTRLPHPWDSPGKNNGMSCHFLLQCMKMKSLNCVQPSATPWTAAFQTPPSMGFSRQEYWSGVPLPSPSVLLLLTKTAVSMCTGQNGLPADRQAPSCDNTFLHLYYFFHSCLCTVSTR